MKEMKGIGFKPYYCSGKDGRIFICDKRDDCVYYDKWKLFTYTPDVLFCKDFKPKDKYYYRKIKIKRIKRKIK